MEGQRALSGTSGNKLTVSSVTRRGQEVTRGAPCETSCPRVCPGETSWGCTTDDCARESLSPLVLGLRRHKSLAQFEAMAMLYGRFLRLPLQQPHAD